MAQLALAGLASLGIQAADARAQSYSPAVFDGFHPATDSPALMVFPLSAKEFTIPLPSSPHLGRAVYGPDSRSLYAETFARMGVGSDPTFVKIDFGPVRVSKIPNSSGFSIVYSFAVSARQDRMIVSGTRGNSRSSPCGIFELTLPDASVRPLLLSSDCRCGSPWRDLSLSPDGEKAIAHWNGCLNVLDPLDPLFASRSNFPPPPSRLESIDLMRGTTTPLGEDLWKAAFSPDGKSIAALASGREGISKTVLIDVKDPSRRRDFGGTGDVEVVWSPDSRYILHVDTKSCSWQHPLSLEIIDVESGKKSIAQNSKCKVPPGSYIGWVSSEIAR